MTATNKAANANSDDADSEAIARFQAIIDRFPDNALAQVSKEQIEEIKKKAADRALAIKQAQCFGRIQFSRRFGTYTEDAFLGSALAIPGHVSRQIRLLLPQIQRQTSPFRSLESEC
jgi:hypothetical protein